MSYEKDSTSKPGIGKSTGKLSSVKAPTSKVTALPVRGNSSSPSTSGKKK